ncbi:hypothetical protein HMPREF0004_4484 [Achromobacter piechaudii ATCC 43553]|uniref:Uncharacterized protein n=1 Tax=Achromobacter piechaudii ATCC 43553 TaxID=742159 RepID=D4XG87_9BURK|nr:hypothetical protein HMPREF0004_4484 [Achromobacter piechaudii ATCC 43553]
MGPTAPHLPGHARGPRETRAKLLKKKKFAWPPALAPVSAAGLFYIWDGCCG